MTYLPVGSFVLGDGSADLGTHVTWWGDQWAKRNTLSGGPAPDSFKGFAQQLSATPPTCGSRWTTGPGNSPAPPATVPAYMAVVVAGTITKTGSTISGDVSQVVVVKTDPGYRPDPGHAGTGTVVAVLCQGRLPIAALPRPADDPPPSLRLDRTAAHVGERLCTVGRDFGPSEPITVGADGVAVAQTTTSAAGTFSACFAAPGNIVAGSNDVSAAGATSGRIASARFTGLLPVASTAYFVGASTAGGDDTALDVLNAQNRTATVSLTFYLPRGSASPHTFTVKAHSRATLTLSHYVRGLRGFGLRVQANRVVAAQMIVTRGRRNPYTALGSGLLSTHWYLAEGYTNLTFHQIIYALNPGARTAHLTIHLLPANGRHARTVHLTVAPRLLTSLDTNRAYPRAALAMLMYSDAPIMVQRLLTFGSGGYGATGNTGSTQAVTTWLFADGGTAHGLQTFLTVLNPGRHAARIRVRLVDTRGYQVGSQAIAVDSLHRGTLRLNDVAAADTFATFVTSNQPIVVERPFYTGNPNLGRTGGSIVFGRNGTGRSWIFPGGDTTQGRGEYLLLLNPGATTCIVRATFYLANGRSLARTVHLPAHARYTIDVRRDLPALRNTLHGAILVSTTGAGFIAEQSIYNEGRSAVYSTAGLAQ